jgi:pyruvate kinase
MEQGKLTKIICTVGPASSTRETLADMICAGMDAARLNFSHGTHEDHRKSFDLVRTTAAELGRHVAVIGDLQGPKIRTGPLLGGGPVELHTGATIAITTEACPGSAERVSTTYQALPHDVAPGDCILIDDGLMELRVVATDETTATCEVINGGPLGEHKGINLPGVKVSSPALTEKDRDDLTFAVGLGVDYLALSFVRTAADIELCRDAITAAGGDVPIIAKLEKPEAMDDLEAIIAATDMVMVARGDLGVELPPERVPILQKQIINACSEQRVPVITATQMLDSMRENPRPTRAEASDVANAIFDGTDAVMLSGETAVGEYPLESVEMMRRILIAAEAEQMRGDHLRMGRLRRASVSFSDALSRAAAETAEYIGARAIVAFTQSGSTARMASKCRTRIPVIAATPLAQTARRCNLYWGVCPVLIEPVHGTDEMMRRVERQAVAMGLAGEGDALVITAGTPIGRHGTTNMMKLQVIGAGDAQ